MPEFVLETKGVVKSFAGVRALKGVDLQLKKGEIHCLAGENGSGKSTLIKIISGVYSLDAGQVILNGKKQNKITPIDAIMSGVQVIYQDFSVFPNLTVMENIALNGELAKKKKITNWKRYEEIAKESVKKINFNVDLQAKVGELSIADKQLVAISRAMINNAELIIMDEPTTALTKKEVNALFEIIKDLQAKGISFLFVSHKLDEVFEISDRFTILRNGENVKSGNTSDLDNEKFTYYMTGRKFENEFFVPDIKDHNPILEVKGLTSKNNYEDISFDLKKGEILGITGLLGSGRRELALSLFCIHKADKGDILINGKKAKLKSVKDAISHKIGYVPEDRLTEGLFLSQSIGRNIIISKIKRLAHKNGFLKKNLIQTEIQNAIEKLSIVTPDSENPVDTLSGGNQQRVVLAKWLATQLDILILNGPTVGVDIGSKHDIHELLRSLAKEGMAIIIISDDLPEVITTCNRILIMKSGKITEDIVTTEINEKELSQKTMLDDTV